MRVSSKGVGYVEVEGMKEDIEIDPADLGTALDQDRVRIVLYGKQLGTRQRGEVTEILFRNKTKFVGVIEREGGSFFLAPDDFRMYRNILIPAQKLNGAEKGDKVFATMTAWTDAKKDPLGEVIRVLGKPDVHEVEMQAIVLERGFDTTFDPDVLLAAEEIPLVIPPEEIAKRRDFRDILTFTIDPHDAKDFDDALSWKKLQNGNIEVGVHIADVSHYVTPGTRIDKEALERGTSVYLVDRTIPMLPERLSNGICSLVEGEDRPTFSAVFTMNTRGSILNEWFGKTVIHSAKRFTYEEAQAVIDTGKGPHREALLSLNGIAKILRDERIKAGAIAFEGEEVKFELDQNGKPLRVYKKVFQDTNKLIEEFMLLANKRVAQEISLKDKRAESVFVYRVHDVPNEERMGDLRDFLRGIGYDLKLDKFGAVSSHNINRMLEDVRGRAEATMIQMATVRSMAKAVYATKNIGHFGLGFAYYTHFTSPIRRYPDLMVHRLLESYLSGRPVPKKKLEEQEHLARYCSQMEVAAAEAERASVKYKQCEYFAERIGYEFTGAISGVTEWGIYVEDPETKAEGMVHVRDIPNDFYFFEQKNYRIIGKQSGRTYRLGDKVRVKIATVDLKKKLIGMKLV
ncbi:MAG: ribonuclease R [Candidatus Lloydbacteria bacterium RIFCSPHIGHO2_02_FULL_54_17]|uniref:Ribonuclease R n=1 Tax=Candidatus Lloydbacteria bacterium RIFCSPHIGHO2_02_FULL_54_17 TaxID=1798664 RepID=A0A1G2DI44_9BACT|nr:MAG: ribonuclease R [Candidatus Lloydbacteria bacterium RIFCSPHIGHO2_01_FULL_54_11]OGZ12488.1 MAG: ribonuclease R [Candidatus Lloydbacteria bacterium RIFCSPHIGHO2_02_FULL_54_17]OGZ14754.1 MAG: ribonuclease R [Candidatus Lloydbacteria bacterium RIFCSPLOWO2_01_FULL_54_18]OGZ16757.1 MAG: ribonuclease R [Candidatus Lloydbacteria bacterium RIFCSPLOWO2_02_FULL_54_12]